MDKSEIVNAMPENKRMKTLMYELAKGMSMEEFDRECAYWLINCSKHEISPKILPTRPSELLEYDRMDRRDKKLIDKKFWTQPHISQYLDQKQHVKEHNKGIFDKLIEFKEYIPEGDVQTISIYNVAINTFIETQ